MGYRVIPPQELHFFAEIVLIMRLLQVGGTQDMGQEALVPKAFETSLAHSSVHRGVLSFFAGVFLWI